MELKSFLGRYNAKEVDTIFEALQNEKKALISDYEKQISDLKQENKTLKESLDSYKSKESIIAQVMLDATEHARSIEEDYRNRAKQSDDACKQLHDEWVSGMQSASANLSRLRSEAQQMLSEIDGQFASLCSWADNRLETLEKASLPESSSDISIDREILQGANADLADLCRELGIFDEDKTTESEPVQASDETSSKQENITASATEENEIKEENTDIPVESAVEEVEEQ